MAQAILIDTDNLDTTKLAEVFGKDVANQVVAALSAAGLATKVQGSVDAPEEDPCEGCDGCDEDEVDLFDASFGAVEDEQENSQRYKTLINLNGAAINDISVTEEEYGTVEVHARKEGNDAELTLEYDAEIDPSKTSAVFQNGILTVRSYKVQKGDERIGRSIKVTPTLWG